MTISPGLELQALIINTLKGNLGVMALVDGVYDKPPTSPFGAKMAYISLGPTDVVVDDAVGIYGENHSVQIDAWSRAVGHVEAKKIAAAVKSALHDKGFDLAENAFVEMLLQHYQVLDDPDGLTVHVVMTFEAMIDAN